MTMTPKRKPLNLDDKYGYSVRVSDDGLTLDLQVRAETEFTNRQTINALRDIADEFERKALEGEELVQ